MTNLNYVKQGIVIDKLLQSLIVTEFDYSDLLIGDKNAIMVAARVLGYGKDYPFTYEGEEIVVDLSELNPTTLDENSVTKGVNEFDYELPFSKNKITYKVLNGKDEKAIEAEIKGLKRINKNMSADISTRLKHQIISVDGDADKKTIREFVDGYMLARDSASFRQHLKLTQPDIQMTFLYDGKNGEEEVAVPIEVQFFGLTQEYRFNLFKQIHEIIYYGQGYDYDTVYNMPLWLRNITFKFIQDSINQKAEAEKKSYEGSGGGGNTNLDWANPDRSKLK